jgi:hypothetical protein
MAPYGHKRCVGITQFFLEKSINEPKGKQGKKECGNTFVLMALKTLALFHIFPHHMFSSTNGLLTLV